MHRLQQFVASVLVPQTHAYTRCRDEKSDTRTRMLAAELMESFLWLHLGTEIGAFPHSASRDIYQAYFSAFFRSLLSVDTSHLDEMKAGRIYVAHSDRSNDLRSSLGRFAVILLEKAMRQEDVLSTEQARFTKPNQLRPAFETFLILHNRLISHSSVASFTYHVNFADQQTWRRSWGEYCSPETVLAGDDRDSPISASVCAGYLNLWSYAVKAMTTEQNLRIDSAAQGDDLFRLTDRLKEIDRWRVRVMSRETSTRFDDIRASILQRLEAEITDPVSKVCVDEIRASMNSAFKFWFAASPVPIPEPVPA